jgi:hypothetical protein
MDDMAILRHLDDVHLERNAIAILTERRRRFSVRVVTDQDAHQNSEDTERPARLPSWRKRRLRGCTWLPVAPSSPSPAILRISGSYALTAVSIAIGPGNS